MAQLEHAARMAQWGLLHVRPKMHVGVRSKRVPMHAVRCRPSWTAQGVKVHALPMDRRGLEPIYRGLQRSDDRERAYARSCTI